jgi:hypothetical protein
MTMPMENTGEAAGRLAIQEFPNILWNPKFYYPAHKNPPLTPILSHVNPVHITASYFSKIRFNIKFPPTSSSCYWSFFFWISH